MRYNKTLLFAILFAMVMPLSQAAYADTAIVYTQEQVNKIVAEEVDKAVKAEVARQVDTEKIDLKIEKSVFDKLVQLQSTHDSWMIGIVALLFTIAGIVIPLYLNKRWNDKVTELETSNNKLKEEAKKYTATAEASLKHADFSVALARVLSNKDIGIQLSVLNEIITDNNDEKYVAFAYNARGNVYRDLGKYDKAIGDYSKAIMKNNRFASAYRNRGFARCKNKLYEKGMEDYNKSIELNPDDSIAYYNRGQACLDTGLYKKAIEDLRSAKALNPDNAEEYEGRIVVCQELIRLTGELNNSKSCLEKAQNDHDDEKTKKFEEKIKEIEEKIENIKNNGNA